MTFCFLAPWRARTTPEGRAGMHFSKCFTWQIYVHLSENWWILLGKRIGKLVFLDGLTMKLNLEGIRSDFGVNTFGSQSPLFYQKGYKMLSFCSGCSSILSFRIIFDWRNYPFKGLSMIFSWSNRFCHLNTISMLLRTFCFGGMSLCWFAPYRRTTVWNGSVHGLDI